MSAEIIIGLSANPDGIGFRCGTCEFFKMGVCHNPNKHLNGKQVQFRWCCNLYKHPGMKIVLNA